MNLIKEWREHKDKTVKETLSRIIDIKDLDEKRHQEILDEEETKIKDILQHGLDIGTIIRYIIPVTLTKYEGEFYFKAEDGELFRVSSHI